MPPKQRTASATTDEPDTDIVDRVMEMLSDKRILKKLREHLFPKEIVDKLDILSTKIERMAAQLIEKDNVIKTLLQNVNELEKKIDHHEQYSRRANIRIHGV